MNKKTRREQIEWFLQKCKAAGLNVTPQRLAIYSSLLGDSSHPNPDAVYRHVKLRHPTISPATVYKTLDTFERNGIITRLTHLHECVRYDPVIEQHHHIICVRCKKVVNLPDGDLNAIRVPAQVRRTNKILGYSVHFNVLCSSCRRSS